MKKLIKNYGFLLFALIVSALSVFTGELSAMILAAPPVVLDTQKIVFMRSLQEEYEKIDTWLLEAQDLSSFVVDGQTLRFPEAGADPDVYKNRTTDIDSVEPTEDTYDVSLDYYDSQNYKMRNINMHALPFDKIQYYTTRSSNAIKKKQIADAAYRFAPDQAGHKKIIIGTTGNIRNGLKMVTLDDVVRLARTLDSAEFPEEGRNLVLPSDMWWDLVQNNEVLKGQLQYQQNTGVINPKVINYYGFKIHKASEKSMVPWNVATQTKASQGTAIGGDVVPAGFVFISTEVFRAGGSFDMYLVNKNQNTTGRATEFGFSHRFKADFTKSAQRYSALLYQAPANEEQIHINASDLLEFTKNGGTKHSVINASGDWTVANDNPADTWFAVEKVGNYVSVVVAPNSTPNDPARTGSFTVSLTGTILTATVEVSQAAAEVIQDAISASPLVEFTKNGGTKHSTITATGEWTVEKDEEADDWFTIEKIGTKVCVVVEANDEPAAPARNSSFTVSLTGTALTATVVINQAANE